jgi:indole-3-glycerol phosphate synthase
MNILETIVKHKKEEVALRKKHKSESQLYQFDMFNRDCHSLSQRVANGCGIIAEFKRKSPSKPTINLDAVSTDVVPVYAKAGASASSILTDINFFGGADDHLTDVRAMVDIPLLRKDFIVDPYQIIEAKAIGADAILLIAEILTKAEIKELATLATDLGMDILMEIHTADQISKYHDSIRNIGVNNRNLKTFVTDIQYSLDILPQLPQDTVKVSESGIDHPQTVIKLRKAGFQGFLIGENFMKTNNPGQACADFIEQIKSEA